MIPRHKRRRRSSLPPPTLQISIPHLCAPHCPTCTDKCPPGCTPTQVPLLLLCQPQRGSTYISCDQPPLQHTKRACSLHKGAWYQAEMKWETCWPKTQAKWQGAAGRGVHREGTRPPLASRRLHAHADLVHLPPGGASRGPPEIPGGEGVGPVSASASAQSSWLPPPASTSSPIRSARSNSSSISATGVRWKRWPRAPP